MCSDVRQARARARALASRSELPKPQDGPVASCARHCGPNVLRRLVARQDSLALPPRAAAGGRCPALAAITESVQQAAGCSTLRCSLSGLLGSAAVPADSGGWAPQPQKPLCTS